MRELHLVALSSDGRHLVLSPTKGSVKGAYLLAVSPKLRRALDGETRPAKGRAREAAEQPPEPPAESALTPKEIQARLRAGQTPERVAKAAGVPVERVTRFYGPVLTERAQVVAAAQGAVLTRARRGPSAAPLGDAVAANLAARRIPPPADDAWTAFRRPDGAWVVRVDLVVRGRERRAEWTWDPAGRTVAAADPYAAALAHVEEPVPRRRAGRAAAEPAADERPARSTSPRAAAKATAATARAAGRTDPNVERGRGRAAAQPAPPRAAKPAAKSAATRAAKPAAAPAAGARRRAAR